MFTPNRTRLEDILGSPTQFEIPRYQRDYKWGKDEALELIEDLQNTAQAEDEYLFLGTFIFEEKRGAATLVVDGQQRLTTILLLLVTCRARAKALGLEALAASILQKVAFVDSTTAESKGSRLIASGSIRDIFEFVVSDAWAGDFPPRIGRTPVRRQVKRIRPICEYFTKVLADFDRAALSSFLKAIYNAFAIRIDIDTSFFCMLPYFNNRIPDGFPHQ